MEELFEVTSCYFPIDFTPVSESALCHSLFLLVFSQGPVFLQGNGWRGWAGVLAGQYWLLAVVPRLTGWCQAGCHDWHCPCFAGDEVMQPQLMAGLGGFLTFSLLSFQPPNDPHGIQREDLILSLRAVLASTPQFAEVESFQGVLGHLIAP